MSKKEINNEVFSQIDRYTQGLKKLLQDSFNGDVIVESPDTAFRYATAETEGKLKFPMISIYRTPNIQMNSQYNSFAQYKEGMPFEYPMKTFNEDGTQSGVTNRMAKNVKILYILIDYQIDLWGINKQVTEDALQELIFWLYDNRTCRVNLLNEDLEFSFTISPQVLDNSDLTTYMTNGTLYRYTLSIEVLGTIQQTRNFFTLLHPKISVEELKQKNL